MYLSDYLPFVFGWNMLLFAITITEVALLNCRSLQALTRLVAQRRTRGTKLRLIGTEITGFPDGRYRSR